MSSSISIPFQQSGEPPRHAVILPIDVPSLDSLSEKQRELVGTLALACYKMNTLYQQQQCQDTPKIRTTLMAMQAVCEDTQCKEKLQQYLDILCLQNGPYSLLPQKNHLLDLAPEQAAALASQANVSTEYEQIKRYLFDALEMNPKSIYYPEALTQEQFESLPRSAAEPNTVVVLTPTGEYQVVPFEEMFRDRLAPVIELLQKARGLSDNASFQLYLDAKIEELRTGSPEARRVADCLWVQHTSPVDIVVSTALETYLDGWQGIKGSATAFVMLRNDRMQSLLDQIGERVPQLEASAPWREEFQRKEISLPHLKCVDVVMWAGDQIKAPFTTLAQSLPNDEWSKVHYGTVNMMYMNTSDALFNLIDIEIASAFLPTEIFTQHRACLADARTLLTSLHETGHTMACQHPDFSAKEPREYLGSESPWLEELRADLFAVVSCYMLSHAPFCLFSESLGEAIYQSYLVNLLRMLKNVPKQAHTIARNVAWHYLMQQGCICTQGEGEDLRYWLDIEKTYHTTKGLLARVQEIKSLGQKEAAQRLREEYCSEDPIQAQVAARVSHLPQGRGLIFPAWQLNEEGKPVCVGRPEKFVDQPVFALE